MPCIVFEPQAVTHQSWWVKQATLTSISSLWRSNLTTFHISFSWLKRQATSYCMSSKEHALYLSLFLVPNTIVTSPLVENTSKLQETLQLFSVYFLLTWFLWGMFCLNNDETDCYEGSGNDNQHSSTTSHSRKTNRRYILVQGWHNHSFHE